MKSKKRFVMLCGIMLACLSGMLLSGGGQQVCAQEKLLTQGSDNYRHLTYKVQDIEIKLHVGLSDSLIQKGRYAPVYLSVSNQGKDFEGIFRIYLNAQDPSVEERSVLDKKIQIAAGETKEYSWLYPYDALMLQTALCDKDGEQLEGNHLEKQTLMLGARSSTAVSAIYGCISEDGSALSYLAGMDDTQMEYVQDWMLTEDVRTLDMFDILVINQFDTTQFSEKQITAINTWVRQGGTLILGTGVQPEKTLKAFSGTLLQGTIGDSRKISTTFGTDLDICELQIENMKSILNQGNDMLVGQMAYGRGSVMVASFDLAAAGDKMQSNLQSLFYMNMSMDRKITLAKDGYLDSDDGISIYDMYGEYSLDSGLRATEVNGLPNIALYAVLLLLYAIFIGPILYSILRKRGKREWLWGLIPVSAVVCSVLIYLIGTSTRVKHPYVNYLSQIDLSCEDAPSIQTYMKITSPNNDPFDWETTAKDMIPYRMGEYYHSDETLNLDYQNRIEYEKDKTVMHMENLSAFDSLSFRQTQNPEKQGRIQFTDMVLVYDSLSGIVTNQTEYDLEQCVIICNGEMLLLGDLKQGESVSLDKVDPSIAWVQTAAGEGGMAAKVIGYDEYGIDEDLQALRRTVMLNRCYNIEGDLGGYYFYGFLASGQSTPYTELYDADLYGETAVVQRLQYDDLGEAAADQLGSLDIYAVNLPQEVQDDEGLSAAEYQVEYSLEIAGVQDLLQLRYQRGGNKEFELYDALQDDPAGAPYIGRVFLGKVLAVNRKTGEQDLLFTAGQENVVTDLSDYIDENQKLKLIYQVEPLDSAQYPNQDGMYDSYCLPRLALERRVAK